MAASAFPRVALYFENSILKPDIALLAASSAVVSSFRQDRPGAVSTVDSPAGVELTWHGGGALVDGKPWPFLSKNNIILPAGPHRVTTAPSRDAITVTDLNATLLTAEASDTQAAFRYRSDSRAIAIFDRKPTTLAVDGQAFPVSCVKSSAPETPDCAILLPRGEHNVTARDAN